MSRMLESPEVREAVEQTLGPGGSHSPGAPWTLEQLTVAGLTLRSDLQVAQAAAGVLAATIETAGQRPNPTLSVSPQRVANPAQAVSPWLAAVQINWRIETAGKRAHRMAAARGRAQAAELAVRTMVWKIRGQIYTSLVAASAADRRHQQFENMVRTQTDLLDLLDRRVDAGDASEAEATSQRLALIQLEADLAASGRRRRETRAALAAAIGVPVAALESVAFDLSFDGQPVDVDELAQGAARRAALLGRSDVLSMLDEYAAAEEDLRLELAKQFPDLNIQPGYEFDQGSDKWGLGVSLELPVLYQNQGGIAEARARRTQIAARFDALQATVTAQVDAALASLRGAREEVAVARSLVETAGRQLERSREAFSAGAADRTRLLVAEMAAHQATVLVIDAQERARLAAARLEQAVQPTRSFAPTAGAADSVSEGNA